MNVVKCDAIILEEIASAALDALGDFSKLEEEEKKQKELEVSCLLIYVYVCVYMNICITKAHRLRVQWSVHRLAQFKEQHCLKGTSLTYWCKCIVNMHSLGILCVPLQAQKLAKAQLKRDHEGKTAAEINPDARNMYLARRFIQTKDLIFTNASFLTAEPNCI